METNDFIIKPRGEKIITVNLTIRIDEKIKEGFDDLSSKSNISRNELINMALNYALKNAKFIDETVAN